MKSLACLTLSGFCLAAFAATPTAYTITDLGADQQPKAIDARGTLVGCTISTQKPVTYLHGAWVALPSRGGTGCAVAINAHGVSVGNDDSQGVYWKHGVRYGIKRDGGAYGIARDGTIVGSYFGGSLEYCYTYKDGVLNTLSVLGGGDCYAYAIDPTATYIGGKAVNDDGAMHAFLLDAAGSYDLGALAPGQDITSMVHKVNKHGHATVYSQFDNSHAWGAAYWNGSQLIDIGLHAPGVESYATAINSHSDVLAAGDDGLGHRIFLYSGRTGTTTPLEPLIANPTGWTFDYDKTGLVTVLTDEGVIYGAAKLNGVPHAFMLVPQAR